MLRHSRKAIRFLGKFLDSRFGWPVQYSSCMADVRLGSSESFESMLRRFTKQVEQDRILAEVRRRRFYEKPSVVRKKKEAVKRRKSAK